MSIVSDNHLHRNSMKSSIKIRSLEASYGKKSCTHTSPNIKGLYSSNSSCNTHKKLTYKNIKYLEILSDPYSVLREGKNANAVQILMAIGTCFSQHESVHTICKFYSLVKFIIFY